jgi:Transposase IS116/IS110/IS902 family
MRAIPQGQPGRPVGLPLCPGSNGRPRCFSAVLSADATAGGGRLKFVSDPNAFRSGRDFAAWIGLVPRQDSTGGKQKLGPISKQGDRKDAMRLCHALTAASRGQRPLLAAIHDYEAGMIDYGFRAVRTSLDAMNQAIVESRLRAMLSRMVLRFINRVPPLKRRMVERMGEE